jgi:hypothetical protein
MALMPSYHIYFIALDFPFQEWLWLLGHNAFPKLGSHLMDVGPIQVQFLSNLLIGEVQPHEIQAQNPDPQGLVVPTENGARQIVKATVAVLALVSLALGLGIVMPLLGDALGRALGADYPIRPAHCTDRSIALGVINQILDIQHELCTRV